MIDRLDAAGIRWHATPFFPVGAEIGPILARLVAFCEPRDPATLEQLRSLAGLAASVVSRVRYSRPVARAFFFRDALGNILRLARLLRRERIDVVHSHIFPLLVFARIAAWLARTPIRVSMIPGPYHLGAEPLRRVDRATLWTDHRVVAGCEHTNGIYARLGVAEHRRETIYYGADPARFDPATANPHRIRRDLGLDDSTPLVGQIAYFYPPLEGPLTPPDLRGHAIKGHEYFIEAAGLVLEERDDVRFLLVGDGWGVEGERYRSELWQHVCESGLEDEVMFTGYRSDIADVLAALDVSIQCSLSENLGGTIESLLMERPTIATDVGGMPEAVRHEQTGLVVPPRDARALAGAIVRLLDDAEQARDFGRAGRRLMLQRFTLERTVADVDALYRRIAAETRATVALPPAGAEPAVG